MVLKERQGEQTKSHKWYHLRRLKLTASHFGEILQQRPSTKPDALVKKIWAVNKMSTHSS